MGYNLLINGVYWGYIGYNLLTKRLLTSWDIPARATNMAAFRFHPFRSVVPQVVSDFPQEQGLIFRSIRHTLVPRRGFTKKNTCFFWGDEFGEVVK